jgi:hypothetical protein
VERGMTKKTMPSDNSVACSIIFVAGTFVSGIRHVVTDLFIKGYRP